MNMTYKTFNLSLNALLSLLNVLLTTSNLDPGLLCGGFLLFPAAFFLLFVVDIDLDTELIPKPINTSAVSTDNAADVFTVNLELSRLYGRKV